MTDERIEDLMFDPQSYETIDKDSQEVFLQLPYLSRDTRFTCFINFFSCRRLRNFATFLLSKYFLLSMSNYTRLSKRVMIVKQDLPEDVSSSLLSVKVKLNKSKLLWRRNLMIRQQFPRWKRFYALYFCISLTFI